MWSPGWKRLSAVHPSDHRTANVKWLPIAPLPEEGVALRSGAVPCDEKRRARPVAQHLPEALCRVGLAVAEEICQHRPKADGARLRLAERVCPAQVVITLGGSGVGIPWHHRVRCRTWGCWVAGAQHQHLAPLLQRLLADPLRAEHDDPLRAN